MTDTSQDRMARRNDQKRRYRRYGRTTPTNPAEREARRHCLICHTPLTDHPFVACWRTV